MSVSFSYLATETASTKRLPDPVGGIISAAVENITSFACFPLDPLTPEIQTLTPLRTPMEHLQTFAQGGLDIKEGDFLVVGGQDYPISAVGDWYWRPDDEVFMYIVVQDIKDGR